MWSPYQTGGTYKPPFYHALAEGKWPIEGSFFVWAFVWCFMRGRRWNRFLFEMSSIRLSGPFHPGGLQWMGWQGNHPTPQGRFPAPGVTSHAFKCRMCLSHLRLLDWSGPICHLLSLAMTTAYVGVEMFRVT